MKNATSHAKTLAKLLKELSNLVPDYEPPDMTPEHRLVHAFLSWNASLKQADAAYGKIMAHLADINDLRVSDPREIVELIGERYPQAQERAARLKTALHAVYLREYAVDLSVLRDKIKRDVRAYLDSLDGMAPYVSAVVAQFSFSAHAIPTDDQLADRLRSERIVEADASLAEIQAFLEHHIRAEDAIAAFGRLRAYAEGRVNPVIKGRKVSRTTKKTSKKPTRKITSKKKSSKKKPTRKKTSRR